MKMTQASIHPQKTGGPPTFQDVLLHLNLVEFVGTNDDAVAGEVDAAARLRCFDLLQKAGEAQARRLRFIPLHVTGSPTFLTQNLFRLSLCRRIVILLAIAAQMQVPLSICEETAPPMSTSTGTDANQSVR